MSEKRRETVGRLYQSGATVKEIALIAGFSVGTVYRDLRIAGVIRRSLAERGAERRGEIWQISEARWRELYVASKSGRPNVPMLALALGFAKPTVAARLRALGLHRTKSEQLKIDIAAGRRKKPVSLGTWKPGHPGRPGGCPPGQGLRNPAIHAKTALAHRRRQIVQCCWCGADVEKVRHKLARNSHNFCNPAHYHSWDGWRRKPDRGPRPLILDRLRKAFALRYPADTPVTLERLEKVGQPMGAGDDEYIELMAPI